MGLHIKNEIAAFRAKNEELGKFQNENRTHIETKNVEKFISRRERNCRAKLTRFSRKDPVRKGKSVYSRNFKIR